jgi:hypothetical protein
MRVIHIHWARVLRRSLRILVGFVALLLLGWLGLTWYINAHKSEILAKVTTLLGERVHGDLHIRAMEPSLWKSFPDISLTQKDVTLRDSLWKTHGHSLLDVHDMYVQVNPFALFSHRTEITKITAAHGSIFLYVDSLGNSNTYILSRRDTTKKNRAALVDRFGLDDVHLWYVNESKLKLFHLYFKSLDGTATRTLTTMHMRLKARSHIHEFNFNTIRGSYLHEQDLDMNIALDYHLADKHLELPDQQIRIGGTPMNIAGNFYFNRKPPAFDIHLHSPAIKYSTALSWLSPNIKRVMAKYDFAKPIVIDVQVTGLTQYLSVPLVRLVYTVANNQFITPYGNIDNISYTGTYINEAIEGRGHGDDNSRVAMYRLSGSWNKIPFQSDTLSVTNLLKPVVSAHIKSTFDVPLINDILGGNSISFDRGTATADLRYNGGILADDPTLYGINGFVRITNAGMSYLPRNLVFTNMGATLYFVGDNLYFRNITMRSRNSSVTMEGDALHFLRLYFSDPGKVSLAWKVRGPMVNLNDFISFVGKRRTVASPGRKASSFTRIGHQLDQVLAVGNFSLDASLDKIVYRNFIAEKAVARLTVGQSGLILQQVQLSNGGGTLIISGMVNQAAPNNPFSLKATVKNADVARLFTSFDNFGQKAIAAENLKGRISAIADVKGNVTEAGVIIKNSINGTVSFNLADGELNHFAPLEKVGRFVFKKRNLSAVAVKDLHGQFDIAGSKVTIRPMEIQTSVVNMNVQGVYGLNGGTDIYMEVPLRNPEKEEARTPLGWLLRKGKGFVLHLRAQDPTGEGVKIGWDPLRKGRKSTEEKLTSE